MKKQIEGIIFNTRWMLIAFYFLLSCGLVIYFVASLVWFGKHALHQTEDNQAMLFLVEMMDITMIANLAKMVITGSYNSFISKDHDFVNDNVTSGVLKIKMATSLIGISSIHLLKSFVDVSKISWDSLYKQLIIHAAFIIGAAVLAYVDYLHEKTEEIDERTTKH